MTKHRGPARVAADFLLNLIACNLGPKLKTTPGSESLTQWSASARGPTRTSHYVRSRAAVRGIADIKRALIHVAWPAPIQLHKA
jgi:hypothetical protein